MQYKIFALGLVYFLPPVSSKCPDDNFFQCPEIGGKTVIIHGVNEMTCLGNDEVCNYNCQLNNNDELKACEKVDVVCPYECISSNIVLVHDQEFKCPKNHRCNMTKNSCKMCVLDECDKDAYKCEGDRIVVYPSGIKLKCQSGTICNKDYVQPCDPCIKRKCGLLNLLLPMNKMQ